ncbi:hypothetical protein MHBO_002862 [Bonamia ostreae]|uniref:aspartyl aminopeptidase n=1 Tax=Bonamia ostreae TaxID=126728 RepID=A0ABV2ANS2_9EUKA
MTAQSIAQRFLEFSNCSPTAFHCVENVKRKLLAAGFEKVKLSGEKQISANRFRRNGKYFFTRNESSIVAFAMGGEYQPGNGATVMVAHTDSPGLHLKPVSGTKSSGYNTLAVETYGGGVFSSWLDRDLSIAGRAFVKNGNAIESRLFKIDRPILSIPRLAIHLWKSAERPNGVALNFENHLKPVISMIGQNTKENNDENKAYGDKLFSLFSESLKIDKTDILKIKAQLYGTEKGSIGGLNKEFVYAPRLDNQMMSFVVTTALTNSVEGKIRIYE